LTKVSCILFDLGGVIINWHNSWLIDEISKIFDLSKTDFAKVYLNNLVDLETNKINEDEFWNRIGTELNSSELKNKSSLLGQIFTKLATVNEPVMTASRNLKEKGITLGILSNTEPVTYSIVEELTSLAHFEFKFLSYEIGYTKPDSRIYQYVIDRLPFEKEELFFIDDKILNVESAQRCGIKAIQFLNYKKMVNELFKQKIL